ncbi:HesB/IscA family protein [Paenibacillus sp. SEL3]|uniref:HesB/IscA family protein n=1 Tax=Paenibacillus sp. IHB B 3084 TaxID=867076 RepID=UPI000721C5CF|nr:iron-sulfur cluster biosynthesis family protein [Paenibacillus sp. IHB B 3084]ALP37450.1 adhesin [Paenibacillus sp. IHB B 3084]
MTITDEAREFIEKMMKEAGVSTLRIGYAGAGCCGPSYQLSLEKPQENDAVSLVNEVEVAVDPQVADQVSGLTLGYIQDEQGAGLTMSGGSSCC